MPIGKGLKGLNHFVDSISLLRYDYAYSECNNECTNYAVTDARLIQAVSAINPSGMEAGFPNRHH